ncbi:MAG: DNA translocase FtsK 4TM domain-containing protein [Arsenophonus sp.]
MKKNLIKKKRNNIKILTKIILFIIAVLEIFLIISLISFHPSDPSWSQATNKNVHIVNLAGSFGAWLSDIFLSLFGILGYCIPLVILLAFWNTFKNMDNKNLFDFFTFSLYLVAGIVLIITSCVFVELNIDDLANFSSGGIIGNIFSNIMLQLFGDLGTKLVLLCIWIISFSLFTGLSWIDIAEKIGKLILFK